MCTSATSRSLALAATTTSAIAQYASPSMTTVVSSPTVANSAAAAAIASAEGVGNSPSSSWTSIAQPRARSALTMRWL